jgi:hypothetical protein
MNNMNIKHNVDMCIYDFEEETEWHARLSEAAIKKTYENGEYIFFLNDGMVECSNEIVKKTFYNVPFNGRKVDSELFFIYDRPGEVVYYIFDSLEKAEVEFEKIKSKGAVISEEIISLLISVKNPNYKENIEVNREEDPDLPF